MKIARSMPEEMIKMTETRKQTAKYKNGNGERAAEELVEKAAEVIVEKKAEEWAEEQAEKCVEG
jgi:hypothetical protein